MEQFNAWERQMWAHVLKGKSPDEWVVQPVESDCSEFTVVAKDEADKRDKIERELRSQLIGH